MKNLIRAGIAAAAIAGFSAIPSEAPAYSIFSPTQYYWVLSDGWSIVETYNVYDRALWNTGWMWGDFYYEYREEFTNQWTRHWLYDFESGRWTYNYQVNYQNFN